MYLWQPIPEVHFWVIDISESPLLILFFTAVHVVLWILLFMQVLVLEPLHFIGIKQVCVFLVIMFGYKTLKERWENNLMFVLICSVLLSYQTLKTLRKTVCQGGLESLPSQFMANT